MKISIITITFNSKRTIEDTLNSVLNQTYRPFQYIVIDGRSSDGTQEIIKKYRKRFIKRGIEFIFVSEKDKGISDAFNKGIEKADGEIIGIINSDDKLCDNALNILAENYDKDISVYYGNCIIFNDNHKNEYIAVPKKDIATLNSKMPLFHPATFITKEEYRRSGLYEVDLKFCMDRELLLRILRNGGNFKYVNAELSYYREGGTNQVNAHKCAIESMNVSIKYGMNPLIAYIEMIYGEIHDCIWHIIQLCGLERMFHKKYEMIFKN